MSVIIFGVDDNAEAFRSLTVSSESNFHSVWEPAIEKLNLKHIGDQRWLYRKDLSAIIEEFQALSDYAKDKKELYDIEFHTEIIIDNLEKNWNELPPNAERLWMG